MALWQEALLAQKVLQGETAGYKHHPQLERFKAASNPEAAIVGYLAAVCDEAEKRGYNFDRSKICTVVVEPLKIQVTRGQLDYELNLLCEKLRFRDPSRQKGILDITDVECHPIFRVVDGEIASWEIVKPEIKSRRR